MIPGFVCQRCAKLSSTGTDCPDWGAASLAVPDLIEEMVVSALEDGAQVQAVVDPPGGIAARLRFPLAAAGDIALPAASAEPPDLAWFTGLAAGNGWVRAVSEGDR